MSQQKKPIIGGVSPDGYQDVYEVRILICYLLTIVTKPLTQQQIFEIFQEHHLTDYFTFTTAMSELLDAKQIAHCNQNKLNELILQPLGQQTASLLSYSLPRSVRDRLVRSAMTLLAKWKREQENNVTIVPYQKGYHILLQIQDIGDINLLEVKLFVPDQMQANLIKQRFLKDPATFYANIITLMIHDDNDCK